MCEDIKQGMDENGKPWLGLRSDEESSTAVLSLGFEPDGFVVSISVATDEKKGLAEGYLVQLNSSEKIEALKQFFKAMSSSCGNTPS